MEMNCLAGTLQYALMCKLSPQALLFCEGDGEKKKPIIWKHSYSLLINSSYFTGEFCFIALIIAIFFFTDDLF